MAIHQRSDIGAVVSAIDRQHPKQVYLCCGERYLCQQTAGQIEESFKRNGGGTVHSVDGSTEDPGRLMTRLQSLSLLPGWQIYRVSDTRLFLSRANLGDLWEKACQAHRDKKNEAAARYLSHLLSLTAIDRGEPSVFANLSPDQWQSAFGFSHPGGSLVWADELRANSVTATAPTAEDDGERLIALIEKGLPGKNVLLLLADTVDKRKRLFTAIKTHGEIIDCSVLEGSSKAAVDGQKTVVRELALATLQEFGKTISAKVLEQLFERIGCHPIAVVRETEKLALYADERQEISAEDLDLLVGQTREEAIFALTEALSARDRAKSLNVLHHLLRNDVHPLAIFAALRNFLRRLLIFRSLQMQAQPRWYRGMSAAAFQNEYLPALKENGQWPELLKGHPYALFMSFSRAAQWSAVALQQGLAELAEAEFRLKGSSLPPALVLESLLVTLMSPERSPAAVA